ISGAEESTPNNGSMAKKIRLAMRMTWRDPIRAIARPAKGIETRAPAPKANNTNPRPASFSSRRWRARGISGTQAESVRPLARNTERQARLARIAGLLRLRQILRLNENKMGSFGGGSIGQFDVDAKLAVRFQLRRCGRRVRHQGCQQIGGADPERGPGAQLLCRGCGDHALRRLQHAGFEAG